jgi:DNA repair protein RadB
MMTASETRVQTGVSSLDELLRGGFPPAAINLVYGEATSGKTTLSLYTAVTHLARRRGAKCVYIDSDNKLKTDRLKKIAYTNDPRVLKQFHLFAPNSFQEQEEILEHLPSLDSIDLMIVDSITGLYRAETGEEEETYRMNKELNRQLGYLSELAKTSGACFILTGQVRSVLDTSYVEPVAPRLLSYWSQTILRLEKTPTPSLRQVVLEKPRRPGNVIRVKITNEGMSEATE